MNSKNNIFLSLALSMAMTSLIFYFPANLFPFMTVELYGQKNASTILEGVQALYNAGEVFVAIVVLVASLIIPIIKILMLLFLSIRISVKGATTESDHYLHKALEVLGRWSMLDVFLVAILVAMMKLGDLAKVSVGLGSVFFLLVVIFSMISAEALTKALKQQESK